MSLERQWKLSSRKSICSECERGFQEGDPFHTAIFWNDAEGEYHRKDFCEACWKAIEEDVDAFSFWKSVYEPPATDNKKKEALEKEDAESLLKRLIEENDPASEKTRFILALMLERKKIFQQIDAQDKNGQKLLIFKRRKTEEIYIVPDLDLKMDELVAIQTEVIEMLPD